MISKYTLFLTINFITLHLLYHFTYSKNRFDNSNNYWLEHYSAVLENRVWQQYCEPAKPDWSVAVQLVLVSVSLI